MRAAAPILIPLGISLALAIFGCIPLMGIPGALWMALADPLASLLWGERYRAASIASGPSAWGGAIFATLLQPIVIAPAWWTISYFFKAASLQQRLLITAIPCVLWGAAVGLYMNYQILQTYGQKPGG
jgi:hypothetical protein